MRRDYKGIAAVETLLLLVLVGLIGFILWYVFHTQNNINSTLNTASNTKTVIPKSTTKTPVKTNTVSQIVTTKTSSTVGQYLADTNGKSLYTYGADTNGVSNCTGSCLTDWPIYKAAATTNLPANVTVITRSDNTKQYAYKGMPLYYYTSDTSAGQITGDGVNNFHVAKP